MTNKGIGRRAWKKTGAIVTSLLQSCLAPRVEKTSRVLKRSWQPLPLMGRRPSPQPRKNIPLERERLDLESEKRIKALNICGMMHLICSAILSRDRTQTRNRRSSSHPGREAPEAGVRSGIRPMRTTGSSSPIHVLHPRSCGHQSSVVQTRVSAPCPNPTWTGRCLAIEPSSFAWGGSRASISF